MFRQIVFLSFPFLVIAFSDNLFRQKMLTLYNEARSVHGVPKVTLNHRQTTKATLWAEFLSVMPGRSCLRHHEEGGQNIYFYWSQEAITEGQLASKCADAFYREIKYYNYGIPGYFHPAAHFTEMVWKSVTEIGVGVYKKTYLTRHGGCNVGGSLSRPAIGYMVVIQHNPAGNRDSRKQFLSNVLRPARHLSFL